MTGCFFCGNTGSNLSSNLPKLPRPCTLSGGRQCLACEKLAKIDSKIRQMQAQLTELLKQRHELLPEVNLAHNPVILGVPPELSTMIFELCVPKTPLKMAACEKMGREEVKAPLVLGSVCRGWRELAWSMPRLWTYIDVRLDKVYDHEEEIAILSEWFSRSHTLPLSIHVCSNGGFQFSQGLKEFIRVINQNYHRWETLDVCAPPGILQHFAGGTRFKTKPPPILRSLRLSHPWLGSTKQGFVMKGVVPAPTEVALHRCTFGLVSIDWSQVIRVRLGVIEFNDCVEVLKHTKALQSCKLTDITGWGARLRSSSPGLNIPLPVLRELDVGISGAGADNMSMLCEILTLPALVSLKIRTETLPVASIIALLKRSSCQLQSLSLLQMINEPADLSPLLLEVPSLEHLLYETPSFYGGQKAVQVLGDLAADITNSSDQNGHLGNASQGLLPRLLSLAVDIRQPTYEDWDQLNKFIPLLFNRQNANRQPLKKLHLCMRLEESRQYVLPRGTAVFLLSFVRAGADFSLFAKYSPKDNKRSDLLQFAKEYHGIKDVELGQRQLNPAEAIP